MKDNSLNKLGGLCAILVGISYILIGVIFLMLPADQQPFNYSALYYASIVRDPSLINIYYLVFALGAVLALGALPAISDSVRSLNGGWTRWATNLTYLCFAVTAIDATSQGLDPLGWLGFGAVGVWVLVVSLLAMRANAWPRPLSYIGIAVAVLYCLVVVSNLFGIDILLSIVAGLGGIILAPVWYIWVGLLLRQAGERSASVQAAGMVN